MANNQQSVQMCYYVTVPGQMQPQMAPIDGGMMANQQGQMQQGGYDPQQMQGFNMGAGHGGYAFVMNQDGSNQVGGVNVNHQMGMQPMMMAPTGGGQQMVLVMGMPDGQGQQSMQMVDSSGCGAGCGGCQGGCCQGGCCQGGCQGCEGQTAAPNWGAGSVGHCHGCPQSMDAQRPMGQGNVQQMQNQMPSSQDKRGAHAASAGQATQPSQSQGQHQNQVAPRPAKSSDPTPAESRPATKAKKGLVNKKLDKNALSTSAQNAPNAAASAGGSSSAEQTAPAPAGSQAPAPSIVVKASDSHSTSPPPESNGTAGPVPRYNMGPIPQLPPKAQSAVSSFSASNIKALNLEPMRSGPPHKGRSPFPTPLRDLELPRSPSGKAKAKAPPAEPELPQESQVPQPTNQAADAPPPPVVPVETSIPAAQPAPAQPSPIPAAVNAQSPQPVAKTPAKKNFKLKNEKLARSGTAPKMEDGEAKEEVTPAPIVQEPIPAPMAVAHDAPAVSLMPDNKVFSRELMLRIWQMHKAELHSSVTNLGVSVRPGDKTPVMERKKVPSKREEAPDRANVFGTDMKKGPKKEFLPKPSESAYKISQASDRKGELERNARSLLNKICPDNLAVIVDQLASIKLDKAEELQCVIRIIFKKALAEPHYCETYADMVFALKERYPQFPPENEGDKPATFTRVLLNNCQNEFENMPATFIATDEDRVKCPNPEDLQHELKRKKDMMLANMKFIGHLFLRQLLAVKVIGQVVHDLIGIKENGTLPEEHMIECVLQLLQAIGYTLDESSHGENLMNSFQARLKDLSKHTLSDGKQAFSKRIRFAIEDLLDLRKNKWAKKMFKEQAKTKDEVKGESSGRPGKQVQESHFSTQIAGMKPAYIEELKAQKPKKGDGKPGDE